jgi:Winged helix-turn helix
VARRVERRPITDYEGNRLLRIVRRSAGSVVTWRRAQMVLLAAQAMPVGQIARVTFTSEDRVRDVLHNGNADGFDSLYPRYRGGRPPRFTLASASRSRRSRSVGRTTTTCRSRPGACTSLPTSWSLRGGRGHRPRGPARAAR